MTSIESRRHLGGHGRGVLLVVLLLSSACAAVGPDWSALDAAAARERVRDDARALRDFSAAVSLSIETPEFDGALSGALLVEPPLRMRLRTSKLMQDVFDMVVTPERIDLHWFRDRSFFRKRIDGAPEPAPASADARGPEAFLAQLDGRLFRLALAGFELPQDAVVGSIVARQRGSLVVDEQLASGERLVRRFDGRTLFLEQVELFASDGSLEVEARYDDHQLHGGLWLPTETVLDDRRTGVRFEMDFDDVAVNEGVLPGAFELAPPPGVEVREL